MGVVSIGALFQPSHNVEARRLIIQLDRVAVEQVKHDGDVTLLGKEVRHQLAVLPDTNDIGKVENSIAVVGFALRRGGDVSIDFVLDFGELARGLASADKVSKFSDRLIATVQ